MKYLVSLLFLFAQNLHAQQFAWMQSAGYSSSTVADVVKNDNEGNIYVCGHYMSHSTTPPSGSGCFLSKYSSVGILEWTDTLENARYPFIDIDSNNVVHITGIFYGSTSFNGLEMTGNYDFNTTGFIAKYNAAGVCVYSRKLTWLKPSSLKILNNNSYVITGFSNGSAHPSIIDNAAFNTEGAFVAYFENDICQWSRLTNGASYSYSYMIAKGNSNEIFIAGEYYNTETFVSPHSSITLTSSKLRNNFLCKYNSEGELVWAKSFEPGNHSGMTLCALEVDNNNNIYLTGGFSGTIYFDGSIVSNTASSSTSALLIKYNSVGNVVWHKVIGAHNDLVVYMSGIKSVEGNIYITGSFNNTVDFGGINLSTGGNTSSLFIAKYDSDFNLTWIHSSIGLPNSHRPLGYSGGSSISVFNNMVSVAGSLSGKVSFDGIIYDGESYPKMYVTQLDETAIGVNESEADNIQLTVYPNPSGRSITVEYLSESTGNISLTIRNQLGETVYVLNEHSLDKLYQKQFDFSNKSKGVYFIEIITDKKKIVRKVVIQ
ncbi:MAG TPA: T9SS type A sorting domain-containing protein [Bacteroidia bacterium]|jgi:hypothetical protein